MSSCPKRGSAQRNCCYGWMASNNATKGPDALTRNAALPSAVTPPAYLHNRRCNTRGLVQTSIIATFEVTANGHTYTTKQHYYDDVKYENPNGCRYWTQADGGGFWQVIGVNDAAQGGEIFKYLSPEADNGEYCALNDWANRGTNYHLQVCNSNGCTFPDGAPWRLSASDFRRSAFDRGIAEIESHEDDDYTAYSVSYGNGQTTFDMEVWPWIKERFNSMTGYVSFARCTDLSCDVNTVLRGNQIDQYVTE